jgi:hypothetical protein
MIKYFSDRFISGVLINNNNIFFSISEHVLVYEPKGAAPKKEDLTKGMIEELGIRLELTKEEILLSIYEMYQKGIICIEQMKEEVEALFLVYGKFIIPPKTKVNDNPEIEPLLRMVIKNKSFRLNDNLVDYWANLFWRCFKHHVAMGDVTPDHKRDYKLQIEYARAAYYRNVIWGGNDNAYFPTFRKLHDRISELVGRHDYRVTFSLDCESEPYHFSLSQKGKIQKVGDINIVKMIGANK